MRGTVWLGAAALLALVFVVTAAAAPPSKTGSFVNYSLGEATGTACPGSSACSNIAAEPAIRADGAGRLSAARRTGSAAVRSRSARPTAACTTRPWPRQTACAPRRRIDASRWVGISRRGESIRVGMTDQGEDGSQPRNRGLTTEEAGRRLAALRRVYDEGYISGGTLKALTRSIKARVTRKR